MNYDQEIIKWHGKDKESEDESRCCGGEVTEEGQCLVCGGDNNEV